jgi:uncharacterized membrane protein YphA (DoxX/SURF4 family)
MRDRSASTLAVAQNWIKWVAVVARCALGIAMLYFGLVKAAAPVAFLKVLREYDLTQNPQLLNVVAGALPWMEVLLGALLLCGIAVRGAAITTGVMLVSFTLVVLLRAVAIYQAGSNPFCTIKFDCGCGNGEVMICGKLLENGVLIGLSMLACHRSAAWLSARYHLFKS